MKTKVIRLNEDQIEILSDLLQKEIKRQIYYDYDEQKTALYGKLLKKILTKITPAGGDSSQSVNH